MSVIIPAFNEEKIIMQTLDRINFALKENRDKGYSWEIIVCDNHSTDRTVEYASKMGAKVVDEPLKPIAMVRNTGAENAQGEWLMFIDADSYPRPGLIAEGLEVIGNGDSVGGGSSTFKKGGLKPDGIALLEHMAEIGFIWDISHLAEAGIWQGIDMKFPYICASHANAQALTPTNRHLSDDVIRAVAQREGVMGLVLYNGFLEPRWKLDKTIPITLDVHFKRHAHYIADIVGWTHVGIGSDLDGGFGKEESPVEIDTVADLHKVGLVLPPDVRELVLGKNWLNFLRYSLPRTAE